MKLIVGLGNPGKKYEKTRHNIGFMVIDKIAEKLNIELNQAKFKGQFGTAQVEGEKVFLLKPLTYMNLSGESVQAIMDFYQMDVADLVVIYDDLDLPVGKIRLRQRGSAGGHNGMKSIIAHLGTQDFNRVRVGINRPTNGMAITDYVLSRFSAEEEMHIQEAVERSAEACIEWIKKPFLQVMNTYNQ